MEKEMKPIYPNAQFKTFCYIKSVITRPNIIVGDYSYYDDMDEGPPAYGGSGVRTLGCIGPQRSSKALPVAISTPVGRG